MSAPATPRSSRRCAAASSSSRTRRSTRRSERLALAAQARLAAAGQHRLAPADVLVAALAHRHGAGVLHYDRHFDVLAERSGLSYASVWLAPRGTL